MKLIKCECCGSNQLRKHGINSLICEFCGSVYKIDDDEQIVSKEVTEEKVFGLFLKAEQCRQANKHIDEIQVLIEAIEADDNNVVAWVKLGRAYGVSGLLDKAENCYKKAMEMDPQYPQSYTNMGSLSIRRKNYADAVEYFEKGLPMYGENDQDYPTALVNYAIAVAEYYGDKKKASNLIREAEKKGYKNGAAARKMAGINAFSRFFG